MEQSVLRAASARGQSKTAPANLFTLEKMADGVYGAISRPVAQLNCNAVIFENSNGLLVVDTHSKPSAAAALVAQIRREITSKPVRYLVNSHFHWDHVQGNAAYRKSSTQVEVIASEATRQLLSERAAPGLKSSLESAAGSLEVYRKNASSAANEADKAYWRQMASDTEAFIKEMKDYVPDLPNITVQGDLILHDKAHDLHVVFRGRGHTAGDVSVWCPSKKVAATGDLAHGALPYIGDGYPQDWPVTLAGLGMLGFDKFLGGHGGILTGLTRLHQMRNYIEEVTMMVQEGLRRRVGLAEMQKQITPASLKSLGGGYMEALVAAIPGVPGRTSAQIIAGTVAGNVSQIHAALSRPA